MKTLDYQIQFLQEPNNFHTLIKQQVITNKLTNMSAFISLPVINGPSIREGGIKMISELNFRKLYAFSLLF